MKAKETTQSDRVPYRGETPAAYLRAVFLQRKERNSSYSTRAFARDLGMSQPLLSAIWNGKRPLTLKQAASISVLLRLPQDESQEFFNSALLALPKDSKAARTLRARPGTGTTQPRDIDIERFKAISQWYHLAIADLATTQDFRPKPQWIAKRLSISPVEARDALERLLDLGILQESRDGRVTKTSAKIIFPTTKSETAVREFHKQMIQKGLDQLQRTDDQSFQRRLITGTTMAIPKSKQVLAQERIQKFQQDLSDLLTHEAQGDAEEVYQLNIQWFPLTTNPSASPTRKESK